MDTIFVKHVKDPSPAKIAGLQKGDRLVKVNDVLVTNKNYAQVVQLIQNTPDILQLLVVPKEDDILQRVSVSITYQLSLVSYLIFSSKINHNCNCTKQFKPSSDNRVCQLS